MPSPLLETKLHVPKRRRGLVTRPRLTQRLSRSAESALTLVSVPAGFGKTTLLTEWLAGVRSDGRSAAWVSLDQRDNDPATFWTYLITALRTASPGNGTTAPGYGTTAPGTEAGSPGNGTTAPAPRPGHPATVLGLWPCWNRRSRRWRRSSQHC